MSNEPKHPGILVFIAVYVALLVLLGATYAIAEVDLGDWNFVAAAAIAVAKALLVILFFMEVWYSPRLIWLSATAGFFWLGVMIYLTLNDYLNRTVVPFSEHLTR
jgi:cytochrome c oxidase subunit 4